MSTYVVSVFRDGELAHEIRGHACVVEISETAFSIVVPRAKVNVVVGIDVTPQPRQLTLDHPPSPKPEPTEVEKRDATLDQIEKWRASAIALGREAALAIFAETGRVTSVEVDHRLRAEGHGTMLDSIDGRWAGAIFRRGWKRQGWEPTGSHARPVAIWVRRTEG